MLNYEIYINDEEVTQHILNFDYSENLDDVASSFSFDSLIDFGITSTNNNQTRANIVRICESGQTITRYLGIITDTEHTSDINKYHYSGFDIGFYLNKNKVIIQFKKANIGDAIKKLCEEYQINFEKSPNFTQTVSKIYKNIIFADVVKELLQLEKDKGGLKNYYIDCKGGNFAIERYTYNQNLGSVIANNILVDSFRTINNVKVTHSFQDLKNRVIYSDNNEKSLKRVTRENTNSIATYGLLTEIETVDTNKQNNLSKLAEDKLNELNKIKDTISLSMLGDYNIKKGVVIPLNINDYDLHGTYLIKSCSHSLDDKKEVVSIEVEKHDINT